MIQGKENGKTGKGNGEGLWEKGGLEWIQEKGKGNIGNRKTGTGNRKRVKRRFRRDIGKGKWDIGHGMQAKDTQGHGKGSWFRMHIGKGKGKYRKQERNMLKPKTNPREKGEFRVEIGNWKTGKRSVQSGNRELENWKKECLERIQGTGKWEKGEFRVQGTGKWEKGEFRVQGTAITPLERKSNPLKV